MYSLRGIAGHVIMRLCGILPLMDKVVFSSFNGKVYSDNPRLIFEEMRARRKDIEYVWLMEDDTIKIEGAKVVKETSIEAIYQLATARLWVDNSRKREWIIKRKGQYYVQTWHGNVCIKKIERDAEDFLDKPYIRCAKHDSKIADLMISGSKFRTDNYRSSFYYQGEILEYGTPAADCFYQDFSRVKNKVRSFFHIDNTIKIALYVPTFREKDRLESYNMDYKRLLYALGRRWDGRWKLIIRLHPNIQYLQKNIIYNEDILNGSMYGMANELIIASDLVITDYSGCMFQGLEAGKKIILYASDVENYKLGRGTYFDIRQMPFPLAENNEELERIIHNFDEEKYSNLCEEFKKALGYFNNAKSTKRIVDELFRRVQWEKK